MAFSLPSLPRLPSSLPSMSLAPAAVLNAVSLIASNLPGLNPRTAVYAIVNAETFVPLTIPDSWGELTQRADYQVSDYPVEAGAFAAYNKVKRPGTLDITLIKTGSDLERATWLEAIRQQWKSDTTARYNVITPQGLYNSYTITRLSHQTRQDRGSNMLYLDISLSEVMLIEAPSLLGGNVRNAASGPIAALGRVFPSATSRAVQSIAAVGARAGSALSGLTG